MQTHPRFAAPRRALGRARVGERTGRGLAAKDRQRHGNRGEHSEDRERRTDDSSPISPNAAGEKQSDADAERASSGGNEDELRKSQTELSHKDLRTIGAAIFPPPALALAFRRRDLLFWIGAPKQMTPRRRARR